MGINKIMESTSIKELLSAIADFCLDASVRDDDTECIELKEAVLASDTDILSILASYLCVCEDGDEIIDALSEFADNCKSFVKCKDEDAVRATKEEFETVLNECEEKCDVKSCIEHRHELKIAEVIEKNRFIQHHVRMKNDAANVFLPYLHNIEDKTKYISDIIARVLFFVINKHIKKDDIREVMNHIIPECRDTRRGTMDLFISYFYDVVKYKERKPGIYTEFDSHMNQVIVMEFYKRIIQIYKQTVYETEFVQDNKSEYSCIKRRWGEAMKCEKCKFLDNCYEKEAHDMEERFAEDMAKSGGYPSVDAFWDSMI